MKKLLSVVLVLAIAASMALIHTFADDTVTDYFDYIDDDNKFVVVFDSVMINNEVVGVDGQGADYLTDHDSVINGPAESFGVRGWVAGSQDIESFGYMVDDGAPQMSPDQKATTGEDVVNAATSQGFEYCSRYWITVDAAGLEGVHKYTFLCKLTDGTIIKMTTPFNMDLEVYYNASGSEVPATPTKEPEQSSDVPPVIFAFDDDERFLDGTFFPSSGNEIESIDFDPDKKCEVIVMEATGDPYFGLPLGQVGMDDEAYEVNSETYKYLQIGVRFNVSEAGRNGQFFFQTDENMGFDEPKDMKFTYANTDDYQYVTVNMGKNKNWKGYLADSRLDPLSPSNAHCEYELYYIAFFATEADAKAFGEKWLAEGNAAFPTPEATPTKAPATAATPYTSPVPPTYVPPTYVATEVPATEAPKEVDVNEKSGVNPGLIIGIVAGVVVVAAAVVALLVIKKKK